MGNTCCTERTPVPEGPPPPAWSHRETVQLEILARNANEIRGALVTDPVSGALYLFKNHKCIKVPSRRIWEAFKQLDQKHNPMNYQVIEDLETGVLFVEVMLPETAATITYKWNEESGTFTEYNRSAENRKYLVTNHHYENFIGGTVNDLPAAVMFRKKTGKDESETLLQMFQVEDPKRVLKLAWPLEMGPTWRLIKATDTTGAEYLSQIATAFDAPQVKGVMNKVIARARLRLAGGFLLWQSLGQGRIIIKAIDNNMYFIDMNEPDVHVKSLGKIEAMLGSENGPFVFIWFFEESTREVVFVASTPAGSILRTAAVSPY